MVFLVVDGGFSSWAEWGACSASCGDGQSVRRRLCDDPASKNGGRQCDGPVEEFKACTDLPCPPTTLSGPGNYIYLFKSNNCCSFNEVF